MIARLPNLALVWSGRPIIYSDSIPTCQTSISFVTEVHGRVFKAVQPFFQRTFSGDLLLATDLEDFGFTIATQLPCDGGEDGKISFSQKNKSSAAFRNGRPRIWSGAKQFSIPVSKEVAHACALSHISQPRVSQRKWSKRLGRDQWAHPANLV